MIMGIIGISSTGIIGISRKIDHKLINVYAEEIEKRGGGSMRNECGNSNPNHRRIVIEVV